MLELILVSAFAAFFLAALEPAISFIGLFTSTKFANAVSSLLFSWLGTYLVEISDVGHIIAYTAAGAFIGAAAVAVIEQMTFYGPSRTRTTIQ